MQKLLFVAIFVIVFIWNLKLQSLLFACKETLILFLASWRLRACSASWKPGLRGHVTSLGSSLLLFPPLHSYCSQLEFCNCTCLPEPLTSADFYKLLSSRPDVCFCYMHNEKKFIPWLCLCFWSLKVTWKDSESPTNLRILKTFFPSLYTEWGTSFYKRKVYWKSHFFLANFLEAFLNLWWDTSIDSIH